MLIEGRKVTKIYPSATGDAPVEILRDADFSIAPGEFRALVGRSGVGKTTVLNMIGGLDRPSSGEILFGGQHLETMNDAELSAFRNSSCGFIFQSFFLRPLRTAIDNVIVPLLFSDVSPAEARKRGLDALAEVGLGKLAHNQVRRLSGGQRQRVAIARAVVNNPKLLLADEPTGSLDTHTAGDIYELLVRLNKERGTTIFAVSHDPVIESYGVPLMTLSGGKIVPFEGHL